MLVVLLLPLALPAVCLLVLPCCGRCRWCWTAARRTCMTTCGRTSASRRLRQRQFSTKWVEV